MNTLDNLHNHTLDTLHNQIGFLALVSLPGLQHTQDNQDIMSIYGIQFLRLFSQITRKNRSAKVFFQQNLLQCWNFSFQHHNKFVVKDNKDNKDYGKSQEHKNCNSAKLIRFPWVYSKMPSNKTIFPAVGMQRSCETSGDEIARETPSLRPEYLQLVSQMKIVGVACCKVPYSGPSINRFPLVEHLK